MKKLLIVGAGSFSTEIDELARLLGYTETVFADDHPEGARIGPVIAGTDNLPALKDDCPEAIAALGNNESRMKYHRILREAGFRVPVLVHPTAYVSPDASLAPGCIVRTRAVVSRYVSLGEACIVNVGALIDHDCVFGEGCHILMGAVVRNKVTVPAMTWIKANQVYE